MTEEQNAETTEDSQTQEAEAAEEAQDQEVLDPEVEQKARDWGWVPKEDFRGPEEAWKPADEFVRVGEEVLPVIRARERKTQEELQSERAAREQDKKDFQKRIQNIERTTQLALKRQREQIIADYAAKKRDAASLADTEAYDRATELERQELEALDTEVSEAVQADDQSTNQTEEVEMARWVAQNAWVNSDDLLNKHANALLVVVNAEMADKPLSERLAEVKKRTEAEFPEKFGKSNGSGTTKVEGGSRTTTGSGGGRLAAKLPPEAKEAGQRFVQQELYKNIEEYAKDYFAQEQG